MLLNSNAFRATIDHVFFAAGDSLAIECGVRYLRADGWPLRATAGVITQSPLAMREAEEMSGMSCLSIEQMVTGDLLATLKRQQPLDTDPVTLRQAA